MEYQLVTEVLDQVVRDDMSKRSAARELITSRKTVNGAVNERPELYHMEYFTVNLFFRE